MQITYDTTADDFRIFASYMYGRSSTLRKNRIKQLIFVALAIIVVYLLLVRDKNLYVTLIIGAVAVVYMFVADYWMRRTYMRNAGRMFKEREKGAESRSSTLTVIEDGILAVSKDAKAELKWDGIDRIIEQEDRTYLFLTAIDAIIIPRGGMTEGDYAGFVAAVKARYAEFKSSREQPGS